MFYRLFLFSFESFEKNFSLIFKTPAGRLTPVLIFEIYGRLNVFYLVDQIASFVNLKRQGLLANLENLCLERYSFSWKMDFVVPS